MNSILKNYLVLAGVLALVLVVGLGAGSYQTKQSTATPPYVYLKFDSLTTVGDKCTASVYAKSSKQNAEVFGINLRFFYDATDFSDKIVVKNFAGGYGLTLLGQPKPITGNSSSKTMLAFDGPIRYVNGAIQLNNLDTIPITLDTAKWNRLFDIEFTKLQTDISCAPLVWEKMPNWQDGGFVGGSAGVVVTILADQPSVYTSTNTAVVGTNRNWEFKLPVIRGKYPYGNIKCPTVAPSN